MNSRKRYQILTFSYGPDDVADSDGEREDALNRMGDAGWRVISVTRSEKEFGVNERYVTFEYHLEQDAV
jgi:hypothetical protein